MVSGRGEMCTCEGWRGVGVSVPQVSPEQMGTAQSTLQLAWSGCGDDFHAGTLHLPEEIQPMSLSGETAAEMPAHTDSHVSFAYFHSSRGEGALFLSLSLSPHLLKSHVFCFIVVFVIHRKGEKRRVVP